jgi:hypothetical protein
MSDENKNWSAALLHAHFKSLDQAWSDRNSVMLLLAEIRELLSAERYLNDPEAQKLKERIERFTSTAATRIDRQPMKPAGGKSSKQERKTG